MSQYLADLNTIPSPTDSANQQQESYSYDDDLALFTNAEFFDFDLEQQPPVPFDAATEERIRRENASAKASNGNGKGLELSGGTCITYLHETMQSQIAITHLTMRFYNLSLHNKPPTKTMQNSRATYNSSIAFQPYALP